jgi:hypothetical protein
MAEAASASAAAAKGEGEGAAARDDEDVRFEDYKGEQQLALMRPLIDAELSEPYSVFTYRHFLNNWPHLCILVPPPPRANPRRRADAHARAPLSRARRPCAARSAWAQ